MFCYRHRVAAIEIVTLGLVSAAMSISEHSDLTVSLFRQQTCLFALLVCRHIKCVVVLVSLTTALSGCGRGWFGEDCRMQCHCRQGCLSTAECADDHDCDDGYFGLGCQYVDLFYFFGNGNPPFLEDHNDSTCNPNTTARMLTVKLDVTFRLTWLVLRVSETDVLSIPDVRMNGLPNTCFRKKVFTVSDAIHIFCSSAVVIHMFEIRGFIVQFICSIHVSGGRSLAHVANGTDKASPILHNTTETDNCTIRPNGADGNDWNMTFSVHVILHRVRVYQRLNHTNQGFILSLMSYMDEPLDIYRFNISSPYVDILIITSEPVDFINIHAMTQLQPGERFMLLCKVEAYGDVSCPLNKYGIQCEQTCACSSSNLCQVTTGMCSGDCPLGFYGSRCQQRCPVHCLNKQCHQTSGDCFQCSSGYLGDRCLDECPMNKYGNKCESTCSAFCAYNTCDNVSGNCSACTVGHTGIKCQDCPTGKFGIACSQPCSRYCKNKTCDYNSGKCMGCRNGHIGDTCTECPPGTYGDKCSYTCPVNCAGNVCLPDSGQCLTCHGGYSGMRCDVSDGVDGQSEDRWLYGSVFAVFFLLSIVFMFLVCEKKPLHILTAGPE